MKNIIKKFAVTLFALPLVFGSLGSLGQVTAKADYWVGGIDSYSYNQYCKAGLQVSVAMTRSATWMISGSNISCKNSINNSTYWKDSSILCRQIHGGSNIWWDSQYTYFSGWNCHRRG